MEGSVSIWDLVLAQALLSVLRYDREGKCCEKPLPPEKNFIPMEVYLYKRIRVQSDTF